MQWSLAIRIVFFCRGGWDWGRGEMGGRPEWRGFGGTAWHKGGDHVGNLASSFRLISECEETPGVGTPAGGSHAQEHGFPCKGAKGTQGPENANNSSNKGPIHPAKAWSSQTGGLGGRGRGAGYP